MAGVKTPQDVARRMSQSAFRRKQSRSDGFRRETFTMPLEEARAKARQYLTRFPKAAYLTAVEHWRELPGDRIEFTMRRLPSAD